MIIGLQREKLKVKTLKKKHPPYRPEVGEDLLQFN